MQHSRESGDSFGGFAMGVNDQCRGVNNQNLSTVFKHSGDKHYSPLAELRDQAYESQTKRQCISLNSKG